MSAAGRALEVEHDIDDIRAIDRTRAECRELAARVRELLALQIDASGGESAARADERARICTMLRKSTDYSRHDVATEIEELRHRGPAVDAI